MLSKEKKQKNGTTGKKSFYFCEVVFNYLCEQNRISNVMLIVKLVKTRLTML